MQAYGRTVTQLLSTDVAWVAGTSIPGLWPPEHVPPFSPDMDPYLQGVEVDGRFANVVLGFFVDRYGDRYVMLLDPNHTNGSFPTGSDDSVRGRLRFDFAGAAGVDPTRVLRLDGRGGRVHSLALEGDALSFEIPAGDVLFLKYDTGRSFAGY